MKIGVYTADLNPEAGGAFTYVTEILALLTKCDLPHEFVTVGLSDRAFSPKLKHLQITLLEKTATYSAKADQEIIGSSVYHCSATDLDLCCQLAEAQLDVLWYPDPFHILTLEYPYFLTIWDLEHRLKPFFPELSYGQSWLWREQHLQLAIQRAARLFTGTEAGKSELMELYRVPTENVAVIPLPMPATEEVSPSQVEESMKRLKLEPGFIFYPAQFWPHKNHATLLLALRKIRDQKNRKIHLVLTGSEKGNLSFIKAMVEKLGLEDQVHFLGFVSIEDLRCLYRSALALVFVSQFGPDNLPPLEAFANRCPVISSNLAGAAEQLGNAALLVDPSSPESIADAILLLSDDEEIRLGLIQRGSQRVTRYSPAEFQERLAKIITGFEPIRGCWSEDFYLKKSGPTPASKSDLTNGVLSTRHDLKKLHEHIAEIEADRSARLEVIQKTNALLAESEADRAARLEVINQLNEKYNAVRKELKSIHKNGFYLNLPILLRLKSFEEKQ